MKAGHALPTHPKLRHKVMFLLHRGVICLGERLLPALGTVITALVETMAISSVADVGRLLHQLAAKHHVRRGWAVCQASASRWADVYPESWVRPSGESRPRAGSSVHALRQARVRGGQPGLPLLWPETLLLRRFLYLCVANFVRLLLRCRCSSCRLRTTRPSQPRRWSGPRCSSRTCRSCIAASSTDAQASWCPNVRAPAAIMSFCHFIAFRCSRVAHAAPFASRQRWEPTHGSQHAGAGRPGHVLGRGSLLLRGCTWPEAFFHSC